MKGIIYIMPCYGCDHYDKCLQSDEREVINHLVAKAILVITAIRYNLKIITSVDEWIKESEKLLGVPVWGVAYTHEIINKQGKECVYPKLTSAIADGLAIIITKYKNKKLILIPIDNTINFTESNLINFVEKYRVELMETDPKEWWVLMKGLIKREKFHNTR